MASHPGIVIRLLTWNLFHGRDHPPGLPPATLRERFARRERHGETHVDVNRSLRREFLDKLAGWEWDLALLQEVPPRWLRDLEQATGATGVRVLTSRNQLGALRSALAEWNPDLIASNEGGSNVLLVRAGAIAATGRVRLALRLERRAMVMARVALPGGQELVVANTHLSVPGTGAGPAEALRAADIAVRWADGAPVVLGGDLNLRPAQHSDAFERLHDRYGLAGPTGPRAIDHLLVRGLDAVERPAKLPATAREVAGPRGLAIRLSDHAPVAGAFRLR